MPDRWVVPLPSSNWQKSTALSKGERYVFPNVQLCVAGTWPASTGEVTITRADLAAAVAAHKHLPKPRLKIGHTSPLGDGAPAFGYIDNLRLSWVDGILYGDLMNVPEWLSNIMTASYPQRSIEATFNYESNGEQYRFALTGLALLGAELPAVTSLEDLQDLGRLAD